MSLSYKKRRNYPPLLQEVPLLYVLKNSIALPSGRALRGFGRGKTTTATHPSNHSREDAHPASISFLMDDDFTRSLVEKYLPGTFFNEYVRLTQNVLHPLRNLTPVGFRKFSYNLFYLFPNSL